MALKLVLQAQDAGMNKAIADANKGLGGMGDMAATAGKAVLAVGAVAAGAVAVGIGAAVKAAGDFQEKLSSIKAVSGATGAEMKQLGDLSLQLGKDTSFSASEAAAGIEELVKGGLTIPDIMNGAAKATLNLAAAGGVSIPEAATIAANALAQFNLKGEDMAHVSDLIAGAANASALDVGQFSYSLQAAGAVAATVGFKFDDLATGIAIMGKAGITGSDAGTSLKTMMMNLVPQTTKAAKLMEELGIVTFDTGKALQIAGEKGLVPLGANAEDARMALFKMTTGWKEGTTATAAQMKAWSKAQQELGLMSNSFFDAQGNVKSMSDVAQILQTSMADLTKEEQIKALGDLFGSDAIRAGAVLAKEGAAGFESMATAMGKVSAESVGAEKLNNWKGSVQQLQGSMETAAIILGTAFLPGLKQITDAATAGVNAAIPFIEAWGPKFAEGIGQTINFLVGLVTTLGRIGSGAAGFGELIDLFREFFGIDISGFEGMFNGAMDAITGFVEGARQTLSDLVAIFQKALSGDVAGAVVDMLDMLTNQRMDLIETLAGWARAFIEWIAPMIPPFLEQLGLIAVAVLAWAVAKAPEIAAQLQEWATAFVAWVAPLIPPLLAQLQIVVGQVLAWVVTNGPPLLQQFITDWVPAVINWILQAETEMVPKLGAFLSGLLDWAIANGPGLAKTFLAEWVPAAIGWVLEAVIKIAPELAKLLVAIGTWIVTEGVPKLARLAVDMGVAIVDGIVSGLAAAGPKVGAFLSKLATDAVNAAKAKLGISSPSKVTREEIGIPMVEGIIGGIQDMTPEAIATMHKTTSLAADAGVKALNIGVERIGAAATKYADVVTRETGRATETAGKNFLQFGDLIHNNLLPEFQAVEGELIDPLILKFDLMAGHGEDLIDVIHHLGGALGNLPRTPPILGPGNGLPGGGNTGPSPIPGGGGGGGGFPGGGGGNLQPAAAGMGGMTVIINVAGSVVTEGQLIETVHTGLLRKQQRNGELGFVGSR